MASLFGKAWVCTLCAQGLTRKTSARRHNDRLHNGKASIVRPFEYLMGRLEHRFHDPRDSLEFRSGSGGGQYRDYSINIAHNNRNGTSGGAPLTPHYDAAAGSYPYTYDSRLRTDSVNDSSPQESSFMTTQKLQEFNYLLYKLQSKGYIPAEVAKMYSVSAYNSSRSGHPDILDENLNIFRVWIRALVS